MCDWFLISSEFTYQEDDSFPFYILHSKAAEIIFYKQGFWCSCGDVIAHKQNSIAAALKCVLVTLIYCLWSCFPPSRCHWAEVCKEAVDLVSMARRNKMNWSVHSHCSSI